MYQKTLENEGKRGSQGLSTMNEGITLLVIINITFVLSEMANGFLDQSFSDLIYIS